MPSSVTDEGLWKRAKARAREEGQGDNYAYITAIYKKMGGDFRSGVKKSWAVPGQIPRLTIPQSLAGTPKPFDPSMRLDFSTDRVAFLDDVTRGLGLEHGMEQSILKQVRESLSDPEANFRQRLNQQLQYLGLDPVQRRAVNVRAGRLYRDRGRDQNRAETLLRRHAGLRKARENAPDYGPARRGQGHCRSCKYATVSGVCNLFAFAFDPGYRCSAYERQEMPVMVKAKPRGGRYHARVTDPDTGRHRYYYSEDDYMRRPDAHVSGRSALRKRVCDLVVKRARGGCRLEELRDLDEKYERDVVKDAIRDAVRSGLVTHVDGVLRSRDK